MKVRELIAELQRQKPENVVMVAIPFEGDEFQEASVVYSDEAERTFLE